MRFPSEKTPLRRALVAYHRAQALARNPDYQQDIMTLQAQGLRFEADGHAVDFPSGVGVRL